MTAEQYAYVIRRMNDLQAAKGSCGCSKPTWTLNPELCEIRGYNDGLLLQGSASSPMVCVYCSNCGMTQLFNALLLKLVDPQTGRIYT